MWWLGLVLPVCYVPGITGAVVPTQWVLLSAVLPMTLWRQCQSNALNWLWLVFIGYALLSLSWTLGVNDSIKAIWITIIWALSFRLGLTLDSLAPLWKGLAIGMAVSSAVAVAQAIGYHPVAVADLDDAPTAGLLYNTTVSGAAAALILIGLAQHRLWLYIPGLLPSLVLAQSRGAWLVLGLVAIWKFGRWAAVVALLLAAGFFYLHQGKSDVMRLEVWHVAWMNLSWLGLGPGTFSGVWFQFHGNIEKPGFAHNDYLQLWFEYGIGSLALFFILAAGLARAQEQDWPVFAAFACLSTFYFPLYCPLLAFIGMVVAGHVTRARNLVCLGDFYSGLDASLWGPALRPYPHRKGLQNVPME